MEKEPEHQPGWNNKAERFVRSLGRSTDPLQLRNFKEEIKLVDCVDEDGVRGQISIDGASPAQGPYISKPFNPNHN